MKAIGHWLADSWWDFTERPCQSRSSRRAPSGRFRFHTGGADIVVCASVDQKRPYGCCFVPSEHLLHRFSRSVHEWTDSGPVSRA